MSHCIGLGAHAEKSLVLTRRLRACNHRSMYVIAAVATTLLVVYSMTWFRSKVQVRGKHVIITGGSEGLGFSLAKEFCMKGSHVTIIARTKIKLFQAIVELQEMALPEVQVQALTADVTQYEQERITNHAELPRSPMLVDSHVVLYRCKLLYKKQRHRLGPVTSWFVTLALLTRVNVYC